MSKSLHLTATTALENTYNTIEGRPDKFVSLAKSCSALDVTDRRIEMVPVNRLTPYKGNARTHSKKQIRQIADSIKRFGFLNPVLIDDHDDIIAGHGRVEAAKLLGQDQVPVLRLSHLSPAEKRAYVLADNKLASNARWDREVLAIELQGLIDLDFAVELTGFEPREIDFILDDVDDNTARETKGPANEDALPGPTISRAADLWLLDRHQLLCGDACDGIDAAVKGWQAHTGKSAILAPTGQSFDDVEKERLGSGSRLSGIEQEQAAAVAEAR
jgi:hypothetical protein